MSDRDRWSALFDSWAAATGISCTLMPYTSARSYRTVGEWWKDGSRWCLHLSAEQYASFTAELDDVARSTLSWSLKTLSNQQEDVESVVLQHLSELLGQSELIGSAETVLSLQLDSQQMAAAYRDGWFVLIQPQMATQGQAGHHDDLREVTDAVFPGAFMGRVDQTGQAPRLLLFCRTRDMLETVAGHAGEAVNAQALRLRLTEFADMVEEDAMVACSLFVSRYVRTTTDISDALLTIALMAGQKHRLTAPRRLYIWGEQPVQILLAGLPGQVVRWFQEAVDAVHNTLQPQADIRETLFGLMAANLNVSEAARHLYIHRNTLLNRLERIRAANGYDLRDFHDALVMWLRYMLADGVAGGTDSEGDVPISNHY